MRSINVSSDYFCNPECFNISSRIRVCVDVPCSEFKLDGELILDDYYGELIRKEDYFNRYVYTDIKSRQLYIEPAKQYFYLPHKRVPIYECDSIDEIERYIGLLRCLPGERILYRGQTRTYSLNRDREETYALYGDLNGVEPSFLTSGCRKGFDNKELGAFWNYFGSVVANDLISVRSKSRKELEAFVSHPRFDMFSYGIAQHYGLPSVGLDLTDSLDNALWFASNN